MQNRIRASRYIREAFGDPIGSYAGTAHVGVADERESMDVCKRCGMLPIGDQCGCMDEGAKPCAECEMLEAGGSCGCTHTNESEMEEVAPPGKKYEKMVKRFKKEPDVESPYALAWYMYNKEKGKE